MHIHIFRTSFATLALTATAALGCPTASDLRTGILLTTADGHTEVHKATGKDMIQVNVRYNDGTGDGAVMELGQGIYLRSVVPIEGGVIKLGQADEYASAATLRSWPAPVPSANWENTRPDGGTARSGPQQTTRIGACTYDSFEITMGFADDPTYTEVYTYLPDLGIGLLTQTRDDSGAERYRYVGISAQ